MNSIKSGTERHKPLVAVLLKSWSAMTDEYGDDAALLVTSRCMLFRNQDLQQMRTSRS